MYLLFTSVELGPNARDNRRARNVEDDELPGKASRSLNRYEEDLAQFSNGQRLVLAYHWYLSITLAMVASLLAIELKLIELALRSFV
jgi:hypothetical protein